MMKIILKWLPDAAKNLICSFDDKEKFLEKVKIELNPYNKFNLNKNC